MINLLLAALVACAVFTENKYAVNLTYFVVLLELCGQIVVWRTKNKYFLVGDGETTIGGVMFWIITIFCFAVGCWWWCLLGITIAFVINFINVY